MGCPGCLPDAKEKQQQLEALSKKAKEDAVRLKKLMVLYSMPDGNAAYMEAGAAHEAGIIPIGFISHFEPASHDAIP